MNFDLDIGQWIVIALSAFLFIWFFAANSYNRRRGIATYRWLYRALEELGEIAHAEWIGASNAGARLLVKKAVKPFRRVEAIYLLEPREFPPYWAFSRLRGKRDEVVVKITLRSAPKGTIEARRESGRRTLQKPPGEIESTTSSVQSVGGFELICDNQDDARLLDGLKTFLTDYGATVNRISLQSEAPHLVIHSRLSPILHSPADAYFSLMRNWFQEN